MGKSLCKIVKSKKIRKEFEEYRKLVKNPRYVCVKCGRTARSKRNLCEPEKI